ncbi:MAG TPA: MFS transporter [Pirellulales bacterium]|nr:MFS transporter [Pirellulales bacterium]
MALATADSGRQGDVADRPTAVRYQVLLLATASSFMLYVDRYCLGELLKHDSVTLELGLNHNDLLVAWSLSAFFWSYALLQVPSGWLADRFGPRWLMTFYVIGWSLCAAATGWVNGFVSLFAVRIGLGVMQAGAYPTSGNIVSRWMPLAERARASSVIALGGRLGAATALVMTTALITWSWRATMMIYGVIGCFLGAAFAIVARDWPAQHPRLNAAELALIERGRPSQTGLSVQTQANSQPLRAFAQLVRSASMWAMCVAQFATNIGWVFLLTWLPRYLTEVRGVTSQLGANMNAIILFTGMFGMLSGGGLTDVLSRRLGLRHGRALPLALSRFLAAGAYLAVPYLESPWEAMAAFCIVSFATDLGVPGTWAYTQDVGGPYVAAVLGWGNMWGNLGAAIAPVVIGRLSGEEEVMDWNLALLLCAGAFVVSGIAAFFIDATKPVVTSAD